jgi:hypothetical protein
MAKPAHGRHAQRQEIEPVNDGCPVHDHHQSPPAQVAQDGGQAGLITGGHHQARVHQEAPQALHPAVVAAGQSQPSGQARQMAAAGQIQAAHQQRQIAPLGDPLADPGLAQTRKHDMIGLLTAVHRCLA